MNRTPVFALSRRAALLTGIGALAHTLGPATAFAAADFAQWVASFKPKALAKGVSSATYDRVMNGLVPDTRVYALANAQPEFSEQTWQYINRRVSD